MSLQPGDYESNDDGQVTVTSAKTSSVTLKREAKKKLEEDNPFIPLQPFIQPNP